MKHFLGRILAVFILFVLANAFLIFLIPKDENTPLCAYLDKIDLIKNTASPRIILLGGSSVAFGTDSKRIADSLNYNVVNFGLHAGFGIRYLLEDCLKSIKAGDIVVLQIEYENFFNGGHGNDRALTKLLIATNWRNIYDLSFQQCVNVIYGIPEAAIGNLSRLIKYPIRRSWNMPSKEPTFRYTRDGFNQYGDLISHYNYPSVKIRPSNKIETRLVDKDFIIWLNHLIERYDKAGAILVMLPPVDVETHHKEVYNDKIAIALKDIGWPYVVNHTYMVLDDSCSFNGGYHVNKEGVRQNTNHIIEVLRKELN